MTIQFEDLGAEGSWCDGFSDFRRWRNDRYDERKALVDKTFGTRAEESGLPILPPDMRQSIRELASEGEDGH